MNVSPDGQRYIAMADRHPVPYPFQGRVLVPWICGRSERRWSVAGWISTAVVLCVAGAWAAASTGSVLRGLAAVAILAPLRGAFGLQLRQYPVLVDLPAMALAATGAALLEFHGAHDVAVVAVIVVACVAATAKESAPVFMALFAWSPIPLVGLVAHGAVRLLRRGGPEVAGVGPEAAAAVTHPIISSRNAHAGRWFDGGLWLLPWGPCLVAFAAVDLRLGAVLAVAYTQTLVATDTERLYQWAALPMAVAAVTVAPEAALVPMMLAAAWWPWKGQGI